MNSPEGVAVSGTHAYVVAKFSNSLAVVDVSTPTSPSVATQVSPLSVIVSSIGLPARRGALRGRPVR